MPASTSANLASRFRVSSAVAPSAVDRAAATSSPTASLCVLVSLLSFVFMGATTSTAGADKLSPFDGVR